MTKTHFSNKKTAVIIGAGPAGLTAAIELLRQTNIHPIVIEAENQVGGIAKTINHNGNRIDIGGHRFFSKNEDIMKWWASTLPLQGKPALDDLLTNSEKNLPSEGPDPENCNKVMLIRNRISHIFYKKRFFKYPVDLSFNTIANLGILNTLRCGIGFIVAKLAPRNENSLEDFYINRFGKPLYNMFFKNYTQKVWGKKPNDLAPDWGAQRVNGLSLSSIIKNMFAHNRQQNIDQKGIEKSLIEQFIYPKYGPGQLWETVADNIISLGGEIKIGHTATAINCENNNVQSVTITDAQGATTTIDCDYVLSSMPIKELIPAFNGLDVPTDVQDIANKLPYRDFITVGLLVHELKISNSSKIKTYKNRTADTWMYIQDSGVICGRLQFFNNWSPYLVNDYKNTMWVGLEYFCNECDNLWNMTNDQLSELAAKELEQIGIIHNASHVIDSVVVKVKKAYPAYFGNYQELPSVVSWINTINNLYCIGRNGQHRYNNMDHSMLTAIEAVKCIKNNLTSKDNVWNVNAKQDYIETNNSR